MNIQRICRFAHTFNKLAQQQAVYTAKIAQRRAVTREDRKALLDAWSREKAAEKAAFKAAKVQALLDFQSEEYVAKYSDVPVVYGESNNNGPVDWSTADGVIHPMSKFKPTSSWASY